MVSPHLYVLRRTSLLTIILGLVLLGTQKPVWSSSEGERKVDFLLKSLETANDFKVRIAAANALGKVANGTVADWMLRAFRKEENNAVRLEILYSVGQIPDSLIIPPLLELINEEVISEQEILAIERIIWNYKISISKLAWAKVLLESTDRNEKENAAYLFGLIGDRSLLPILLYSLKDPISNVRMRSVQAIGRIGHSDGISFCKKMAAEDRDDSVRKAAQTCLGEIDLNVRGTMPLDHKRRVDLKIDLYGLQPNSVTPELFRVYIKRNVNPRVLDQALAMMQTEQAQERSDKSVQLIRSEDIKKSAIKFNVRLYTAYAFQVADLNRLRDVVKDKAGYINQCYLEALKTNRSLKGDITAQFMILGTGAVTNVEIIEATLTDTNVQKCVGDKVRELPFPKIPLKYVTMKYTFNFFPPKDVKYEFEAPSVMGEQRRPGARH